MQCPNVVAEPWLRGFDLSAAALPTHSGRPQVKELSSCSYGFTPSNDWDNVTIKCGMDGLLQRVGVGNLSCLPLQFAFCYPQREVRFWNGAGSTFTLAAHGEGKLSGLPEVEAA